MRGRVWIDLANSPHVLVFAPIVDRLSEEGWQVILTARDHAQTIELAERRWPELVAIGGASPPGRRSKAKAILDRALALRRFARDVRPTVALSHGSYAQILAARAVGVPVVTMMDYEHQPANHVSFRLARRVIVPNVFPATALHRHGASKSKVVRYEGFKEELYLAGFEPNQAVFDELGLNPDHVIVVLRTPPNGALYHQGLEGRFDELLEDSVGRAGVTTVLLPRNETQSARYARSAGIFIPPEAVDGPSLLACADLVIGGGGTMTREAALLGTPTYTVFAGPLAAVDAELVRTGKLHDLRQPGSRPRFEKHLTSPGAVPTQRAEQILRVVSSTVADVAG